MLLTLKYLGAVGRVNFSYNLCGSLHFDQIKFSLLRARSYLKHSTGVLCFLVYPKMAQIV